MCFLCFNSVVGKKIIRIAAAKLVLSNMKTRLLTWVWFMLTSLIRVLEKPALFLLTLHNYFQLQNSDIKCIWVRSPRKCSSTYMTFQILTSIEQTLHTWLAHQTTWSRSAFLCVCRVEAHFLSSPVSRLSYVVSTQLTSSWASGNLIWDSKGYRSVKVFFQKLAWIFALRSFEL